MVDLEITIVIVLAIAAGGSGAWSLRLPAGAPKAFWGFLGGCLFGVLFCFVGIWNLVGIHTARRITAMGTITGLEQRGGRASFSDFTVVPASGQPVKVHSDYAGNRLHNGDDVLVTVLSFHSTLLHLEVITGRDLGWKLDEGDGTRSAIAVIVLGGALILGARARRLSHPEG